MDIGSVKSARRSLVVPVEGGEVKLSYCPGRLSVAFQQELAKLPDDDPSNIAAFLLGIGLEWDLTDSGEPYPVTQETLLDLPAGLLLSLVQAVTEDTRPNPLNGGKSASGLPETAAVVTRRSGIGSSA